MSTKWKVVISYSLRGDPSHRGSPFHGKVRKHLKDCGIEFTKAGNYQGLAVPIETAAAQLHQLLDLLSNPQKFGINRGRLGHLWMYIEAA